MQGKPRGTPQPIAPGSSRALHVIAILGTLQILAWGSTFYLLAVLAPSIVRDTGWSYQWVMAGVCIGLFVAGVVSPPSAVPSTPMAVDRCWPPAPRCLRSARS